MTALTSTQAGSGNRGGQASNNPLTFTALQRFVASWLWLLPAIVVAVVAWNLRWMSDDGWINMRVVDQMLAGNGPVFNTGERVEVGTSTLWLWLLIGVSALIPWFEPSQLAMVLGTGLMATALVLASLGSMHLLAPRTHRADSAPRLVWVPAGTAMIAALPPIWEFATSGLEMSLAVCWLAACFWGLARRLPRPDAGPAPRRLGAFRPWWLPVLIGLGPLVRPDFALFALAFAIALLVQSRLGVVSWAGAAVLALAIPGAYQVFRMGYYAALVPNTALAKDASGTRWAEGLSYLLDFIGPYAVWVPLVLIAIVQIVHLRGWAAERDRARIALTVAVPVAGLLHATYIVRVGGDFMHARFLLPATVAIVLPIAAYPLRRTAGRITIVFLTAVLLWAITVAAGPRTRYELIQTANEFSGRPPELGIANERGWWQSRTMSHRTVRIEDWIWAGSHAEGALLARWDRERDRSYYREGLVRPDYPEGFAHSDVAGGAMQDHIPTGNGLAVPAQPGVFIAVQNIGAAGVLAGNDVHLIDMIGLSDAVSARVRYDPATNEPRRVGHEVKPVWWRLAHYAAPTAGHSGEVATARRVLRCRPVRNVVRATTAELTPRLFLSNVRRSVEYTRLTIPADPRAAEQKLCR